MSWKSSKILHVNRKAYFLDQTRWKLQRQWNECRCCVGQWRMDGHTFDSGFMTSLMTIDEEMRRQMCQGLLTPKQCSAVENLHTGNLKIWKCIQQFWNSSKIKSEYYVLTDSVSPMCCQFSDGSGPSLITLLWTFQINIRLIRYIFSFCKCYVDKNVFMII